jgi:hypothetical protein
VSRLKPRVGSSAWNSRPYGLSVLRRLLSDHLALGISTLAATTIVAKVWTVAHGGPAGIAALVSAGGLTSLLGALLAGLPAIGTVCLVAVGALLPEAIREGDAVRGPILGTAVGLLIGFALAPERWFFLGLTWLVVMTVLSFILVGARERWTQRSDRRLPFMLRKSEVPQNSHPFVSLALIALVGWAAVAASDRPWLPPEDVATKSGTITGYVLDDSSDILLMQDSDRSVIRIPADEISKRTICTTDERSPRSLLSRIFWSDASNYPDCSGR